MSSVTNYAEPEIVVMQERGEICENVREPDDVSSYYGLYDKVMRDSICEIVSSFYNTYDISTSKKLYQNDTLNHYRYDPQRHAYISSSSHGSSGSSNSKAAVGVFLALIGVLLVVVFAYK